MGIDIVLQSVLNELRTSRRLRGCRIICQTGEGYNWGAIIEAFSPSDGWVRAEYRFGDSPAELVWVPAEDWEASGLVPE